MRHDAKTVWTSADRHGILAHGRRNGRSTHTLRGHMPSAPKTELWLPQEMVDRLTAALDPVRDADIIAAVNHEASYVRVYGQHCLCCGMPRTARVPKDSEVARKFYGKA